MTGNLFLLAIDVACVLGGDLDRSATIGSATSLAAGSVISAA
jgi:hypothetical protein